MDAAVLAGFRAKLTAFVERRVSSPADAEELVQDILLRLHTKGAAVEEARLPAWLYRVARNIITDYYRNRATVPPLSELPEELPASADGHDGDLTTELATCLDPLLAGLPTKYAEAVRLADLEGHGQQLVADRLGLSLSGAKSRIQRGRALLHHALAQCCAIEVDHCGNVIEAHPTGRGPACAIDTRQDQ